MSGLADLDLRPEYRKGRDDVAGLFYVPCMSRAIAFDRAVGFFSSTIYSIAWQALREFVHRGGRIRIVCSPVLSPQDIEALEQGYDARVQSDVQERLVREVETLLSEPSVRRPAVVLSTLVALDVIDLRIAIMTGGASAYQHRIFHDKVGLFYDEFGNIVVFKGSMNETWAGLSSDGNLDSVDVFVNWADSREKERVASNQADFESIWGDNFPSVRVLPFPDAAREALLRSARPDDWETYVGDIVEEGQRAQDISADQTPGGRVPRPHQISALEAWEAGGRRGVFEHATGSGKTFTALCAIRDSLGRNETPVVFVPSELLLKQWTEEVASTLADIMPQVLLAGAGNDSWKDPGVLSAFTRGREGRPRVVIATMQTGSSDEFLARASQGSHLFVIADEVHRVGSQRHQRLLQLDSGPRLGLSATPRRAGDQQGTSAIFGYFGDVVPPPFTLADAVASGALTRYFYYAHGVRLTAAEQTEWNQLTNEIRPLQARENLNSDPNVGERIKRLLIRRARITKAAAGKVPLAVEVISESYRQGEHWLVYCESQSQLSEVLAAIRASGINALEYHSAMTGDRERTLSHFTHNGGVLVSIRCLDEGVDIPAISHALILASSKNPREFIQRRGRVLRRYEGKRIAFVHDAIVLPATSDDDPGSSILMGEVARAVEFGLGALNPSSIQDLQLIAVRAGLAYESVINVGFEDDDAEG